jgi:EpsI family protein
MDAGGGSGMSTARSAAAALLLASALAATRIAPAKADRDPAFDTVPYVIGSWMGTDAPPADPETEATLGADAILHRTYTLRATPPGSEAGTEPGSGADPMIALYIAYYREQRPGVSVHSPLHCLPGTGWEPEDARTLDIDSGATHAQMKRLIVRKNLDRAVVLYAYSVHGRLIASELLSKFWLLQDRMRHGRGDAALVRIVVPITEAADAAEQQGVRFTRDVLAYVSRLWS